MHLLLVLIVLILIFGISPAFVPQPEYREPSWMLALVLAMVLLVLVATRVIHLGMEIR